MWYCWHSFSFLKFLILLFLLAKKCQYYQFIYRSSHPEVFLGKGVLKICSKFTVEHPCWSMISIKLLCSFNEIALQHGCSPVNLLHIFRTPFTKNTFGKLFLYLLSQPWKFFDTVVKLSYFTINQLHEFAVY